jgi:hypothetical protein
VLVTGGFGIPAIDLRKAYNLVHLFARHAYGIRIGVILLIIFLTYTVYMFTV